ncbi:MAG: TonB-dependent receptor plug domain-containing protein, partial [Planctomycetes bacterium]|nr:TonB-dependent receptor plug domain-containing protein [Planctomycetota bacterium]
MRKGQSHCQPARHGRWPVAVVCLCIVVACVVLEDNQARGQQSAPPPPASPILRQVSSTQDLAAGDAADNDPLDDVNDILSLADESLESLSTKHVLVPGMDMEVSTVSRTESTVGRSPAAVFVVTGEMIRRSGARCVPDALRLVPGVNVARVSANRWAISIRGFNSVFANKLLVQIDG